MFPRWRSGTYPLLHTPGTEVRAMGALSCRILPSGARVPGDEIIADTLLRCMLGLYEHVRFPGLRALDQTPPLNKIAVNDRHLGSMYYSSDWLRAFRFIELKEINRWESCSRLTHEKRSAARAQGWRTLVQTQNYHYMYKFMRTSKYTYSLLGTNVCLFPQIRQTHGHNHMVLTSVMRVLKDIIGQTD